MEELINVITKASVGNKILALTAVVLFICGGFFLIIYQPQLQFHQKKKEALRSAEQNLIQKKAISQNLEKFHRELEKVDGELKKAISFLPNQSEIPQLLSKITSLAQKAGLQILEFTPLEEVVNDFYADVPVNLSIVGTYHEIAVFTDRISKLSRIVNISDIDMSGSRQKYNKILLNTKLKLTTYRFVTRKPKVAKKSK